MKVGKSTHVPEADSSSIARTHGKRHGGWAYKSTARTSCWLRWTSPPHPKKQACRIFEGQEVLV
eukprot:751531-Hanusia_phi.AAC.1